MSVPFAGTPDMEIYCSVLAFCIVTWEVVEADGAEMYHWKGFETQQCALHSKF